MDDVLGDFFSEIEKVEHVVSTQEKESGDVPSVSAVETATSQVVKKAAAIEIKMVKAVPNITYVSDSKVKVSEKASSFLLSDSFSDPLNLVPPL